MQNITVCFSLETDNLLLNRILASEQVINLSQVVSPWKKGT